MSFACIETEPILTYQGDPSSTVTWKTVAYDLTGYNGVVFYQPDSYGLTTLCYLTRNGVIDTAKSIPVSSADEAKQFRDLCGFYFGVYHTSIHADSHFRTIATPDEVGGIQPG